MERLVNLFSDFDFEAGKCTLMHLRMLPDASVNGMNYQWSWCPRDASRDFYQANTVKKRGVVTLSF